VLLARERTPTPRPLLCFIHIERAGGTTLHHILRNNYLSFATLTPSLWSNEADAVVTAQEIRGLLRWLPFMKGFGGHSTRLYAGYEEATSHPVKYFTFLRHPVARYLSHFRYQVDTMGLPWSLEAFLDEPRFANFMTNRIAGRPDLARAKELLRTRCTFVGLTERFDESLLLLQEALNLPDLDVRYERQNEGKSAGESTVGAAPLDDHEILERVQSRNELDLELYDFAANVLFPDYVSRYGADLERDRARFQAERQGFRFSRSRRLAWAVYRKAGYEPVGRAVRRWQRR
jgi:hypothetical protein